MANAPAGRQPADLGDAPRPVATPDRTIHMIGNSHIDPVWLWPWQEGYQEARATFWSAIQRMDEYPDFVFTCDQVVLLAWVEESDPDLFARIRQRVAEGRWVNVGGWWVEPDCNMPMGESLVRQGLVGQRWLQSRFGRPATVGMNVDPFGHSASLPTVLRGQGMDSYLFLRPGPHESDLDGTLFWWQAPDGSRVLAYRIPFEYGSAPGPVDFQVDKSLGQLDRSLGDVMVLYGVGNHGGGPTIANIESIHRFDRMGSFGRLRMSDPRTYLDTVLARGPEALDALPVRADDLQHHAPGCYSAHSGIKAWQRRAQHALLTAERWAAVVAVHDEVPYPRAELEGAWKQVLFNQFHDVLPGSAIESAYDDARDQLGAAVAVAKRVVVRAHNVLARQVDVPFEEASQPVLVLNPHPWPVSADVELHHGSVTGAVHVVDDEGAAVVSQPVQSRATTNQTGRGALVFRAEVPALGYRLHRVRFAPEPAAGPWSAGPPQPLHVDEGVLENDLVRVELDPVTGWLRSYLVKATGLDVVAGTAGAPHTQVCADPTDTWGHRVVSYAWPGEDMATTRVVVRERGPLRARLRVERAWGGSTLVEELVLDHDSAVLRVDATLDWHEPAHLLKLRFPTALASPRARFGIPFAEVERPVDGAEEPAQGWVDLTGTLDGRPAGLTVVMRDKHGWDVSPGEQPSIGVTAVRSPVYAWHDPRLLQGEDVYTYQDQGVQRFAYELVPHDGDRHAGDPARRAEELGQSVRAQLESFHPGPLPRRRSFASDGGGAVMVTALKGTEDATDGPGGTDLVVRALETRGTTAHARLELPLVGRTIEADLTPYAVRTWLVPADRSRDVVEVDLVERPLGTAPGPDGDDPAGDRAAARRDAAPPGEVPDDAGALSLSERVLSGGVTDPADRRDGEPAPVPDAPLA
ncbi:alpha-mannosidase [Cellulomonas marina]|uniref:Alpha-mannosidase n=1 Tax=Cellulomonas marina TaxID=988821 RepID=A0A1I1A4M0_9CELL|nr:alpha-mannosidase [Cellulomonas marina]GIG29554.1 alpha-mannosidase [Cellulomonas marina]SFB32974.1 alpha-mannosidase [Cellulomonas marina]